MQNTSKIVDLHSHILFSIDDGSKSLAESVLMAKEAASFGVKIIAATPHRIKGSYEYSFSLMKNKVDKLNKELKRQKIDVKIVTGAENYVSLNLNYKFRLNKSKYFLLEFPMHSYPNFCSFVVDSVIAKGLIPVIAEVETNADILKKPSIVEDLVSKGCLMQLSSSSLFSRNKSVRLFTKYLLKNDVYDLITSDAHNVKGYTNFDLAISELYKSVGKEKANSMIYKVPNLILLNKKVKRSSLKLKKRSIFSKIF